MTQGILPFQFEEEQNDQGQTSHAGLFLFLDLFEAMGLRRWLDERIGARRDGQGFTDSQMGLSLILLNLAGGECVSDLDLLEADRGFCRLFRMAEAHGLSKKKRKELAARFRGGRSRALPSASSAFRYLECFHDAEQESLRLPGRAFIPRPNRFLQGLSLVNRELVSWAQLRRPRPVATLDMDATLVETNKREALFCYKRFKAYQPLNVYWFEQELIVHSEFRDGNVPAGYEQLRVLKDALDHLPGGVQQARMRSDTAGYQHELLAYCDDGDSRFGRIEFAVSCDVTAAFKAAVLALGEDEWRPLPTKQTDVLVASGREWAEVCFVPNALCGKKHGREYRYLATRELLSQPSLPGMEEQLPLPFPTLEFAGARYKIFGVVTNMDGDGGELIGWHDQRCGQSEQAHSIMKSDLAGGQLPSGNFGANAAWWSLMLLALNAAALLKTLALGGGFRRMRMKGLRFHLLNLSGRVVSSSRRLMVRLSRGHPWFELLLAARRKVLALARAPAL